MSTVRIALDKVSYEIDLTADNEARLRDKLAKFVDAATEVKSKPAARRGRTSASMTSTRPDKERTRVIRQWPGPTDTRSPAADVSRRRSGKHSAPVTKTLRDPDRHRVVSMPVRLG